MLASHCGAVRVAFNWGLAQVKANLAQREAERSYGIADDRLTPALSWSMPALRKRWNQVKDEIAPWWAGNSKEAYASGLARLADALANWRDSRQRRARPEGGVSPVQDQTPRGPVGALHHRHDPAGRPHPRGPAGAGPDQNPRAGHQARPPLAEGGADRLGDGAVAGGPLARRFTVHTERPPAAPARPDAVIGVDLGIKTLAVFSDGRPPVPNPRHLNNAARKLRRLSRAVSRKRGPDRRTQQRPSKRWQRTNAARNGRSTGWRRCAVTASTSSPRAWPDYGTIVVEDLNVAGMLRNRRLARAIADAGFGEIRRQLAYKTGWHGGRCWWRAAGSPPLRRAHPAVR